MIIIALTKGGVLIEATSEEANVIIRTVTGKKVEKLEIGQKLPAIDYAASITKIKALSKTFEYTALFSRLDDFTETAVALKEAVDNASNIDL